MALQSNLWSGCIFIHWKFLPPRSEGGREGGEGGGDVVRVCVCGEGVVVAGVAFPGQCMKGEGKRERACRLTAVISPRQQLR